MGAAIPLMTAYHSRTSTPKAPRSFLQKPGPWASPAVSITNEKVSCTAAGLDVVLYASSLCCLLCLRADRCPERCTCAEGIHVHSIWTLSFWPECTADMPCVLTQFCPCLCFSLLLVVTVVNSDIHIIKLFVQSKPHYVISSTCQCIHNCVFSHGCGAVVNFWRISVEISVKLCFSVVGYGVLESARTEHSRGGSLEETWRVSAASTSKIRMMECSVPSKTFSSILRTHSRFLQV